MLLGTRRPLDKYPERNSVLHELIVSLQHVADDDGMRSFSAGLAPDAENLGRPRPGSLTSQPMWVKPTYSSHV